LSTPERPDFGLRGALEVSGRHVVGLVARLPLDAAAQARELRLRHGHTGKNRVEGGAEIPPADRDIVAGAGAVELSSKWRASGRPRRRVVGAVTSMTYSGMRTPIVSRMLA
jgi:hypothetical protein